MIKLYTAPQCELCDHAKAIVERQLQRLTSPSSIQEIDITQQIALKKRYGLSIPVLAASSTTQELAWPFDEHQCATYLRDNVGTD